MIDPGQTEEPSAVITELVVDPKWRFLWMSADGKFLKVLRLSLPNQPDVDLLIYSSTSKLLAEFLLSPEPKVN